MKWFFYQDECGINWHTLKGNACSRRFCNSVLLWRQGRPRESRSVCPTFNEWEILAAENFLCSASRVQTMNITANNSISIYFLLLHCCKECYTRKYVCRLDENECRIIFSHANLNPFVWAHLTIIVLCTQQKGFYQNEATANEDGLLNCQAAAATTLKWKQW